MKKLLTFFFVSVFFLACSEENEFMKFSDETLVINIVKDSVFINGETVATLSQDFYGKDLQIAPIEKYVNLKARQTQNVHIRCNTGDAYETFYKIAATLGFTGVNTDNMAFVVGESYETPIHVLSKRNDGECAALVHKLHSRRDKIPKAEYVQMRRDIDDCNSNYLRISVSLQNDDGKILYTLGSTKTELKIFEKAEDVANAVESIQNSEAARNKLDKNRITFVTSRTTPMAQIVPVLVKLQEKNFAIIFAVPGT